MHFETKLKVGQIIDERYRIISQIGSGGMSIVYLADDLRLKGKRWAVKECLFSEDHQSEIQTEAEILTTLNHIRLPRVVDFYLPDQEGYSYLIMDYIEGVSLNQLMKDNPGPLPSDFIIRTAKQLLEVLQYLHGHHPPIIYRDLKPSNIMLTKQKELMLIDFGIARAYRRGCTEDTVKLGTVGFAAPEQYGGGQSQPTSDLYGLGALLLYMATGGKCSQWESGMENKLHNLIPDGLIPVLRRLLRHHPAERYQNAASVLEAIARVEDVGNDFQRPQLRVTSPIETREANVIALLGVASGLGTTHTSFVLNHVLSTIGVTAWVDCSPEANVYDRIRSMLDTQIEYVQGKDQKNVFSWKGIHYWKRPLHGDIDEVLSGDYEFVVLDLGTGGYDGALELFNYSDIPILIASGADWRLEELLHWIQRNGMQPEAKWRVGLPFADKSAVELLQATIGVGKVHGLPFQQNPFMRKGKLVEVMNEIVEDMTIVRNKGSKRRFFR